MFFQLSLELLGSILGSLIQMLVELFFYFSIDEILSFILWKWVNGFSILLLVILLSKLYFPDLDSFSYFN